MQRRVSEDQSCAYLMQTSPPFTFPFCTSLSWENNRQARLHDMTFGGILITPQTAAKTTDALDWTFETYGSTQCRNHSIVWC